MYKAKQLAKNADNYRSTLQMYEKLSRRRELMYEWFDIKLPVLLDSVSPVTKLSDGGFEEERTNGTKNDINKGTVLQTMETDQPSSSCVKDGPLQLSDRKLFVLSIGPGDGKLYIDVYITRTQLTKYIAIGENGV